MLRAGIFLDVENIVRCGGWGIRFRAVRQLLEAHGATVIVANAYMAIDGQREAVDSEFAHKKADYRDAVRREGFHLTLEDGERYEGDDGGGHVRPHIALDLVVDALQQAEALDMVLLGGGDANYTRLVQALRARGRRVDLLSFENTSTQLRNAADNNFNGFLYPGILPESKDDALRLRGIMHHVIEEKGFGFLTVQTGLAPNERRDDVFLHINDFTDEDGNALTNEQFAAMKRRQTIIEFDLIDQDGGKCKAADACEFLPSEW